MHVNRTFSALFALTSCLAVATPQWSSAAQAQVPVAAAPQTASRVLLDAVRESIRINPALADGVGERALLTGVRRAVSTHPQMSSSIVASAKTLRPQLAMQIEQVAQSASVAPSTVQIVEVPPVQSAPVAAGTTEAASAGIMGGIGNQALLGLTVAAAATAAGAALAGDDKTGGSSSGGGGANPPAEDFETQEYNNQWGLGAINASTAYSRGATGEDITVAVLDSGLLTTHTDIDGNIAAGGYNEVDDDTDVSDGDGHGTHVSGIIAAERDGASGANNMHGVAFNAKILPYRILDDTGSGISADAAAATDRAILAGAPILNGSFGPDYRNDSITQQNISVADAFLYASYQDAVDAGMVLVFSAGNDNDDNPAVGANPTGSAIYPYIQPANAGSGVYDDDGNNYDFSGLEGLLVAVVATQSDGSITSFSHRCGVAADWCIAAPGDLILSTWNDGGYVSATGTSQAAPHVSGAVAVLMDMFPELEPEEIVERLFETANKTGIYADASTYGQGFLDLAAATQPIGALSIATGESVYSGASYELAASNMNLGAAFGDGLSAALVGQKLAVFDQQKATFVVDLSSFAQQADSRFSLDEALRRFRSRFGAEKLKLADGSQLSYSMVSLGGHDSVQRDPSLGGSDTVMEIAYSRPMGDTEWVMNYNINPATMFGLQQSTGMDSNAMISRDAFAAPYLSFVKQGYSMGSHVPLGKDFTLNMGAFQGYSLADEMREEQDRAESYGHMAELVYAKDGLTLSSQAGMLTEKNAFLGSRSEGAFDLESGTHTSFAGVNGAYALDETWSFVGSYYRGVSSPKLDGNSLFNSISDVQTESFSLGFMGEGVFHAGDRFGVLGNQPLRVVNGEASLGLTTGRSRSGLLYTQNYTANLAPTGRELNMEAFYHFNLPDTQTQLMSAMMYRSEPGHIENAPDEALFLMQLQQPF